LHRRISGRQTRDGAKEVVRHCSASPTALLDRRHNNRLGVSASKTTSPYTGSTATGRTAPDTAPPCRKPANSWTDIRGRVSTTRAIVARVSRRRRRRFTTALWRTRRPRAGRLLVGGRRRRLIAADRLDITPSPPTALHRRRDWVPTRSAEERDASSPPSAEVCTSLTATTTAVVSGGGGMVTQMARHPSTTAVVASRRKVSGICCPTKTVYCRAVWWLYITRFSSTAPTTNACRCVVYVHH